MNFSNADTLFFAAIVPALISVGIAVLSLVIFYWLIKKAIRTALADHYKTVRHYESTGRWTPGPFRLNDPPFDARD
jgi:hypothetical protein